MKLKNIPKKKTEKSSVEINFYFILNIDKKM
jgi:hypothetical protein